MRRYFTAIGERAKVGQGWPLAFCSGFSNSDSRDWSIETVCLRADEVPEVCNDAKPFSELVAGLLNCYFNKQDATKLTEEQIMKTGRSLEELNIPHPSNPLLPF